MTMVTGFFERPRFREGVATTVGDRAIAVDYREQGCDVDIPAEARGEAERLMAMLHDGASIAEMGRNCPGFADSLDDMLTAFDKLGLLTDAEAAPVTRAVGGMQFYRDLMRFAERMTRRVAEQRFHRALVDGTASRNQVVGYAIEYFHVVNAGVEIIAPALPHATRPASRRLLQDFLASELDHDKTLARSLEAVGIARDLLEELQPLPSTFALISAIGVLAAQDPLSFKSVLFLMERPSVEFHDALVAHCRRLDMPPAFHEPLLWHADINDEADHGSITRHLLADVAVVTPEEQLVVKKHVGILVETLVAMEREILDYYGDGDAALPLRRFA